jgi:hypothetical protein
MLKKIKMLLQLRDGIWSIPLTFLIYVGVGLLLGWAFGYGTGTYDPGFIQPLFLAIAIVVGATNGAVLTIYFTVRGIHRYIYGHHDKEKNFINLSKEDFKNLKEWQKISCALFILLYFVSAILIVYLRLV